MDVPELSPGHCRKWKVRIRRCDGGETGVDCTCCAGITYDVSLEKQTVVVKGDVPYEDVLEKIKKTGKEVSRVVGRFMMRSELGVRYCLAR